MISNWLKFTVIFTVASAFLLAGFLIAWYPSYMIQTLELNLGQNGLTQAEINSLQWTLVWWSDQGEFIFSSVSSFVIAGGILVLIYAIVYSVVSTWRESIRAKVILAKTQTTSEVEIEEQETENFQPKKTGKKLKTGFPTAAGILTIITSSIIMAFSIAFIVAGIGRILTTTAVFSSQSVSWLGDGLIGALVFGFSLTAGIMILKRKNFVLSIIGLCFMLVKGTTFILVTGELLGISLGIVIIAITILSLIFTSISYKEFS
jgi:hypothetical protein